MRPSFQSSVGDFSASAAALRERQFPGASRFQQEKGLLGRLRDWRLRRRRGHELAAMSDRELADIGFRREQLPALLSSQTVAGTLSRMLTRLGLEEHPYVADTAYRAALERTCATCPATRACRRWMSRAGPVGEHRRFCPNAFEFDLMAKSDS
jgi:uncharacterized protein YjiS (DUF1127 family)